MKHFSRLLTALEEAQTTREKEELILAYFRQVPEEDAAWALYLLNGGGLPLATIPAEGGARLITATRTIPAAELRQLAAEASGLSPWLFELSERATQDLAETISLLLGRSDSAGLSLSLQELVETRLLHTTPALILQSWQELSREECYRFTRLLQLGSLRSDELSSRPSISRKILAQALSVLAEVGLEAMSLRLARPISPTAESLRSVLRAADEAAELGRPLIFKKRLALTGSPAKLGAAAGWHLTNFHAGVRCQLIRRESEIVIWSEAEELLNPVLPELVEAISAWATAGVVEGTLTVFGGGDTSGLSLLERRLARRNAKPRSSKSDTSEGSLLFYVDDILELAGEELNRVSWQERMQRLPDLVGELEKSMVLRQVSQFSVEHWREVQELRTSARTRGAAGVTLQERDGENIFFWPAEPYLLTAVLISAGRALASSEYSFGVWQGEQLLPIAKVEIPAEALDSLELEKFVRENTLERFGPVRTVRPELVFEIHFDGLQASTRHKAGIKLQGARVSQYRRDLNAADATSLLALQSLLSERTVGNY